MPRSRSGRSRTLANTTVDTGTREAATSSWATWTSRWAMLSRPSAVGPRVTAMIQFSSQLPRGRRRRRRRTPAPRRTPSARTGDRRRLNEGSQRHPPPREQGDHPLGHDELATSAHTPPPRSATATATTWASSAATSAWTATTPEGHRAPQQGQRHRRRARWGRRRAPAPAAPGASSGRPKRVGEQGRHAEEAADRTRPGDQRGPEGGAQAALVDLVGLQQVGGEPEVREQVDQGDHRHRGGDDTEVLR